IAERLAEKFGVQPEFTEASSGALPYPAATFDYVFGNGVLHHVELSSTAGEVRRVLKPGGGLFCRAVAL
ncbi:MAG TPA: class I SAM-dependent methyltransferase, partial [Candidatus Omnitrophota bacterium]|nr:class I SAM-dependent methyltransferase [Candidatus Omnitrophota bacterium]